MTKISKAKSTKAKAADTPKARPISAVTRARLILCDKPAATNADLAKALEGEGHKLLPSSVAAVRSDFMATVRALQESGLLKKQLI